MIETMTTPTRMTITTTRNSCFAMLCIALLYSSSISLLSRSVCAFSSSNIQTSSSSVRTIKALSMMEGGWDNDNFLESLGKANNNNDENNVNRNDALDRANDEYYRQSKYGRPVVVDPQSDEATLSSTTPASRSTKLSYAEALQQQQQRRQQQQQRPLPPPPPPSNSFPPTSAADTAAVSDAAAEIYAYSYNKNVAPQQQQRPPPPPNPLSQTSNTDTAAISDAAAEMYEYSYNKNVAPPKNDGMSAMLNGFVARAEAARIENETKNNQNETEIVHTEESSQGGSRFRGLMKRAREKQANFRQPDTSQNPLLTAASSDGTTPPSSIMTPEEIANLSVQEQARLYREFFYVQQKNQLKQQPQQQQASPQQATTQQVQPKSIGSTADNYLEAGIGFDGRKIGRNKDADAVSNAGDVYFAQLKLDSTTRNLARYSGDEAKANEVFHDPAIKDISAPVNPYLQDQQKRMRDVIETVPEEMLVFQEYDDPDSLTEKELKSHSGVSYKQKIAQKKREREKRNNGNDSSY